MLFFKLFMPFYLLLAKSSELNIFQNGSFHFSVVQHTTLQRTGNWSELEATQFQYFRHFVKSDHHYIPIDLGRDD